MGPHPKKQFVDLKGQSTQLIGADVVGAEDNANTSGGMGAAGSASVSRMSAGLSRRAGIERHHDNVRGHSQFLKSTRSSSGCPKLPTLFFIHGVDSASILLIEKRRHLSLDNQPRFSTQTFIVWCRTNKIGNSHANESYLIIKRLIVNEEEQYS
jgi:hypothetical protein